MNAIPARINFKNEENLRSHVKLHQNENLLPCEYCEKTFTRTDALKQHRTKCMLLTKIKENFSCQLCNKNFKSANILHVHEKTHSDKRGW